MNPAATPLDEIQDALAPLTADPKASVIFSDLDGTLAPIRPKPETVSLPAPVCKLIRDLAHSYLAVVVISGRPATEAKRIVGNSELAYIGNHGFETMLPGHAVVVSPEAQPYLKPVHQLVDYCRSLEEAVDIGVWVEDKTVTMSLHYRRASDPEAARRFIDTKIMPLVEELGLRASEGRMVIEVRPPVNINKGVAVGDLLDRLDARRAVYIGDDTTDVDALKELRRRKQLPGTVMVGVGVISAEMPPDLPRYSDALVGRGGGVETVLRLLAGEEL